MNDKKAQLQKAIITNNMELVRDFYEYVFSEKAPAILNNISGEPSSELSFYKDRIKQAIEILSKGVPAKFDFNQEDDLTQEETDDEDDGILEQKPTDIIKESNGMQFISSKDFELPEDSMPKYADAMKKLEKRKKTKREPYKPRITKCESCGKDFDFNKEYPVGQLESGANAKTKCNKCRSK